MQCMVASTVHGVEGKGGRIERDKTEGHMLKVWRWELLLLVVGRVGGCAGEIDPSRLELQ